MFLDTEEKIRFALKEYKKNLESKTICTKCKYSGLITIALPCLDVEENPLLSAGIYNIEIKSICTKVVSINISNHIIIDCPFYKELK